MPQQFFDYVHLTAPTFRPDHIKYSCYASAGLRNGQWPKMNTVESILGPIPLHNCFNYIHSTVMSLQILKKLQCQVSGL